MSYGMHPAYACTYIHIHHTFKTGIYGVFSLSSLKSHVFPSLKTIIGSEGKVVSSTLLFSIKSFLTFGKLLKDEMLSFYLTRDIIGGEGNGSAPNVGFWAKMRTPV